MPRKLTIWAFTCARCKQFIESDELHYLRREGSKPDWICAGCATTIPLATTQVEQAVARCLGSVLKY